MAGLLATGGWLAEVMTFMLLLTWRLGWLVGGGTPLGIIKDGGTPDGGTAPPAGEFAEVGGIWKPWGNRNPGGGIWGLNPMKGGNTPPGITGMRTISGAAPGTWA